MERRHDIDALRVFAILSLIAYHVGMFYVADWGWHVKSSYLYEWLQWPMLAMNRWRMSLLFLISGLAIGLFQPARAPGRFAAMRTWRLFLPLVFGMLAIVPVQVYCQVVSNGTIEPGFGAFLARFYTFQPWPEDSFGGWEHGITWNHLWYLAYLWVYTLVLTALLPLLESGPGRRLQAALGNLRGWKLWLLPALPLVLYMNVLLPRFEATNNLTWDWFQHAQFFTVFLYGYALSRNAGFWSEVVRMRRPLAAVALALVALYVPMLKAGIEFTEPMLVAARCLRGLLVWSALLAILAWGKQALDRPFRWLPYASEAVYPWYVLHQSAIVLLGYLLSPLQLGGPLEATCVVLGTLLACGLLHEFVIRRVAVLRPLFGLKRQRRAERPALVAEAA